MVADVMNAINAINYADLKLLLSVRMLRPMRVNMLDGSRILLRRSDTTLSNFHGVIVSRTRRHKAFPVYVHHFPLAKVVSVDIRLVWHLVVAERGFAPVVKSATQVLGNEVAALDWLNTSCSALRGGIPLEFGTTKAGRQELLRVLSQIDQRRTKDE